MGTSLPAGTKLDRYEIISQLGAGGMGEVYLAEDTRLRRRVALKILPAEVAERRDRMRRFLQEATAAASLNHPNIATIFETGEAEVNGHEVLHYIAMEFVDGITLREKIHREHTDLRRLLRYLQQVAEGLAKAHAAGVVHRDLKPDNIMITTDGHAKVLDFGLVKLIETGLPKPAKDPGSSEVATAVLPQHSAPGTVLGTVGYMSPEQAQGKTDEIDHRSDIFSFGCILYEAITGHKPFEGESVLKTLHMVAYEPAPPISQYNSSAPSDLQRILRRCLAKDPEDRYQSIKDVAIELKDIRHEMGKGAVAAGIDTTVPPLTTAGPAGSRSTSLSEAQTVIGLSTTQGSVRSTQSGLSSAEYPVGGTKQYGKALTVGLVVLLLVGAGVAFSWYRGRGDARVEPFKSVQFTRLTNGGRVGDAIIDGSTSISADGRYVVFSLNEGGRISLWVRQILTNSSVQIVPPAEGSNGGTTISPDGEFVYYRWVDRNDSLGAIYQVPILGGTPRKIVSGASSPVAFSQNGQRIAFLRSVVGEQDSVFVANSDGSGERKLVTRTGNDWFTPAGPSWSPDGKIIAIAAGSDTGGSHTTVIGVDPDNGATTPLTSKKWLGNVHRVVWLGDGSGLIALAQEDGHEISGTQLWFIAHPGGEVRRITNDLNSYGRVSLGLTADNGTIVTAQSDPSIQIWTLELNEPAANLKQISNGKVDGVTGLTWTPDGKIIYATAAGDKTELWEMDADGSGNQQLTSDGQNKISPTVSPDGRFVFFSSMRSGIPQIWRLNRDGSNPKQITSGEAADLDVTCAPDGQSLVFISWRSGASCLWKVGVDGGEPVQLTSKPSTAAFFSPDGKFLAYRYFQSGATSPWKIAIISSSGGEPTQLIDLPEGGINQQGALAWAPDGRSIIYSLTRNGVSNLWRQKLDGGRPSQITNFTSETISSLSLSNDGKRLAFSRGHRTLDIVLIKNAR